MDNRGYGAAINRAVRSARGETILALNADIVPEAGFLEGVIASARRLLVSRLADHPTAIIGFRLRDADGAPQGSIGRFPTLTRFLRGLLRPRPFRKYVQVDEKGPTPVDWATGACLLIDRRCFEELGGFDESYFLYYEDVDICLRATRRGWRVEYNPSATCRHLFPYHSRRLTIPMVYVARRGMLLYFRKHRPAWEYHAMVRIARWESWLRSHRHAGWKHIGVMIDQLIREPADQLMDLRDWPTEKG
jgi:GT2 family glycosyltransferase